MSLRQPVKPPHGVLTLGEIFRDCYSFTQSQVRFIANVNLLSRLRRLQRFFRSYRQERVRAAQVLQKFIRSKNCQKKLSQSKQLRDMYSHALISVHVREWALARKM